jgi:hypothetical protein
MDTSTLQKGFECVHCSYLFHVHLFCEFFFMVICHVNLFHVHLVCEFVSCSFAMRIFFMFSCFVNLFHAHLLWFMLIVI